MRLRLLKGDPIEVDGIMVYPLTLGEIVELGEEKYNQYLAVLISEPDDFDELKEEKGIEFFDLICFYCLSNKIYRDLVLQALSLFFGETVYFHDKLMCFFMEDERVVDRENYEKIIEILKMQNFINEKKDEYRPANKQARELLKIIKENKKMVAQAKKNRSDLASIISGVVWKSGNVDIHNVWSLTVYQLYDAYFRLMQIDNHSQTMGGVYAGTIDSKKINFDDLSWAKIIKL